MLPTTINIGNANDNNPPITNPINVSGRSTTVTSSFEIPHAAFTPKMSNFPKITMSKIVNNNDNISNSSLSMPLVYNKISNS